MREKSQADKNGRSTRSARQIAGKDIVFIMGFLRDKSLKRGFGGSALIINPPAALFCAALPEPSADHDRQPQYGNAGAGAGKINEHIAQLTASARHECLMQLIASGIEKRQKRRKP